MRTPVIEDDSTTHPATSTSRQAWGSVLLLSGVGLLILNAVETASGVPGLPRAWYSNRPIWWVMAWATTLTGAWWLAPQSAVEPLNWKPKRSGLRFRQIVLYTGDRCGLCHEARAVLDRYRRWLPTPVEIDIATDPRLIERYATSIPVVLCDGVERFRGRVDPRLLERLIEATDPVS
jgi:hypothetical protein